MRATTSPNIIDLDFPALEKHLTTLAEMISTSDFRPEHILYIERAGLYCAHTISKHLQISASGIQAQRSANQLKEKCRHVLRWMPRPVSHSLRKLEIASGLHNRNNERQISFRQQEPPRDRNILILDDALDTGYSMLAVQQHLVQLGHEPSRIRTAVLTVTSQQAVMEPDYFLFQQTIVTFPWSYDSACYDNARNQYIVFQKEIQEYCHA
jgi:hypoxanthine phosphoribosyltransferase